MAWNVLHLHLLSHYQISNQKVSLTPSTPNLTETVNVDETIKDTLLTFIYTEDINVNVTVKDSARGNNSTRNVPVKKETAIKTITADINGTAVSCITFIYHRSAWDKVWDDEHVGWQLINLNSWWPNVIPQLSIWSEEVEYPHFIWFEIFLLNFYK